MARRKRLTPPLGAALGAGSETVAAGTGPVPARAPIAQVAGDAAAAAAFHDVAEELARAREQGRLVLPLPVEAIDVGYLERDRLAVPDAPDEAVDAEGDDPMAALTASIAARGQQTPIEVVALGAGRYGLVSGWRRLRAVQRLRAETGEARFDTVLALLRTPKTSAEAYVAMVEENEIRSDLSFFERARIVRQATRAGAFADDQSALRGLFGATTKARRSKIKSFLRVVDALGDVLRHPTRLSEHLGLKLARALAEEPALPDRIARALAGLDPADAEAEIAAIQTLVSRAKPRKDAAGQSGSDGESETDTSPDSPFRQVIPGVSLRVERGRVTLQGNRLTHDFAARLEDWLKAQERP